MHQHVMMRTAGGTLVLAHHGYRRPMLGWQTASCFSARREAWEVSPKPAQDWLERLRGALVNTRIWLSTLEGWSSEGGQAAISVLLRESDESDETNGSVTADDGTVISLTIRRERINPATGRRALDANHRPILDTVTIGPDDKDWNGALTHEIAKARSNIDDLTADIARFEKQIAGWEPGALKAATEVPRWVRRPGAAPFQVCKIPSRGYSQGGPRYEIWTGFGWERIPSGEWWTLKAAGDAVAWTGDKTLLLTPDGKIAPRQVSVTTTQARLLREIARAAEGRLDRTSLICVDRTLWGMIELGVIEYNDGTVSITWAGRRAIS